MKVIFFDGVCGLCNGFIDFVIKADKKTQFSFSPLQSEFAAQMLPSHFTKDLTSVIYLDEEGKIFTKSAAVIRIMEEIGGLWKFASFGNFLPKLLLNKAYDLVAQNRYQIFGKKETCRIPTPEERARFITATAEEKIRP